MWAVIIFIPHLLTQSCLGIIFIDLPLETSPSNTSKELVNYTVSEEIQIKSTEEELHEKKKFHEEGSEENHDIIHRRLMQPSYPRVRTDQDSKQLYTFRHNDHHPYAEDEKDLDIKNKIATFVQQTVHNTGRKVKSIQNVKDDYKDQAPYKIGFILSMIKKARDVLNELFNVALKHRDEWKALEQLKIFELIVHTNVDTTNLVRQMVEIHIQHLNNVRSSRDKTRMVLL